jgi:hypothetical protein
MNFYKDKLKCLKELNKILQASYDNNMPISISNLLIQLECNYAVSRKLIFIKIDDYVVSGMFLKQDNELIPVKIELQNKERN